MNNYKNFIYIYEQDDNEYAMNIPYYEITKKINGRDYKKIFIIDLRKIRSYKKFLDNFEDFQSQFLMNEYYATNESPNYPVSLSLYFLDDKNKLINYNDILYNYDYAIKDFINPNQFNTIINEDENIDVTERKSYYDYQKRLLITNNFNLVYGLNGSGKTRFLKDVSKNRNATIFNLNKKIDEERYLTSTSEYLDNYKRIVSYCESQNIPLLLDDLCWGEFDGRNKIKLIDSLYDYSHENDVFFTSAQKDVKSLVKKRTHNPNIIEF